MYTAIVWFFFVSYLKERMSTTSRSNKTQRESHSEIERKRRERMKRDTEFLRKQVHSSQYRDKLSIFQAAAERLIHYTDKLGKREYIINDEEYSHLITQNFEGFDVHVRCSDTKILRIHPNVEKILDFPLDALVGRSLHEFVEPSTSTKQILNEVFHGSDLQWDIFKGLIAKNFILALRCGSSIPVRHCVYGSDKKLYRFIEFCGDLSQQVDSANPSNLIITFCGLCRPVDPACTSVINRQEVCKHSQDNPRLYFTLRLSPGDFQITEAVGNFQTLLGYKADDLVHKQLKDLVAQPCRDVIDRALFEVGTQGSVKTSAKLLHAEGSKSLPFEMKLTSIRLGTSLHCIICRLDPISLGPDAKSDPPENCTSSSTLSPSAIEQSSIVRIRPSIGAVTHSVPCQSKCDIHDTEVHVEQPTCRALEPKPPITEQAVREKIVGVTSPRLDFRDEWFRNLDTSGFQGLLDGHL